MKLVRWTRFTWDLAKLLPFENRLGGAYTFRVAAKAEEPVIGRVVMTSFSLDSAWVDQFGAFRERLQAEVRQAFHRESVPAIVIQHGVRIVAASALTSEADATSNLISGPCVLSEYRNRGLGSALLHASLAQLAQAGLPLAHGVSKEGSPASRFVYPKFGSTHTECDIAPFEMAY